MYIRYDFKNYQVALSLSKNEVLGTTVIEILRLLANDLSFI